MLDKTQLWKDRLFYCDVSIDTFGSWLQRNAHAQLTGPGDMGPRLSAGGLILDGVRAWDVGYAFFTVCPLRDDRVEVRMHYTGEEPSGAEIPRDRKSFFDLLRRIGNAFPESRLNPDPTLFRQRHERARMRSGEWRGHIESGRTAPPVMAPLDQVELSHRYKSHVLNAVNGTAKEQPEAHNQNVSASGGPPDTGTETPPVRSRAWYELQVAQGLTDEEISKRAHVERSTASKERKNYGIQPSYKPGYGPNRKRL